MLKDKESIRDLILELNDIATLINDTDIQIRLRALANTFNNSLKELEDEIKKSE